MEFVFLPLEEEMARRIGIPPDRGVPVSRDALGAAGPGAPFDLVSMAAQIEYYRHEHPEDATYDAFLRTYHHYCGASLANQERFEDALGHLEKALSLDPEDDQVREDLARAAFELRHLDRALQLYQQLLDRDRTTLESLEAIARICMATGDRARAVAAAEEARRRFPDRWESANVLTTIYYHNRDVAKLESALHAQLACEPSNVLTLEKLAVYYRECARHGEARTCIERALALDPGNARLRYQSGMIHYGMGRYADAETEFRRVLALEPDHLDTLNGMGLLWLDAARPSESRAAFERALELAPRDYRGAMNLGRLCFRVGGEDRAEALRWFRRALDLGMDDAGSLRMVYLAARELGDVELAERADRWLARTSGGEKVGSGGNGRSTRDGG